MSPVLSIFISSRWYFLCISGLFVSISEWRATQYVSIVYMLCICCSIYTCPYYMLWTYDHVQGTAISFNQYYKCIYCQLNSAKQSILERRLLEILNVLWSGMCHWNEMMEQQVNTWNQRMYVIYYSCNTTCIIICIFWRIICNQLPYLENHTCLTG